MAAFGSTVIGVGLLASLRPDGWRLTVWVAGLLPALLGLTSLVYPDATSSLGLVWALAAIAWGVVFVAAAELTQNAERPTLLGSLLRSWGAISGDDTGMRPTEDRPPRTPRWVNVFGIIVLVPVVLVIGQTLVSIAGGQGPGGGGPGLHGPSSDAGGQGDASPVAQSTPTPAGGEPVTDAPDVTFTLVPIIHMGAFVDARDTRGAEPNPTLRVPLGSLVQVTLENHVGGEYDIYFPDFEAKSERVAGGSSTSIVFVRTRRASSCTTPPSPDTGRPAWRGASSWASEISVEQVRLRSSVSIQPATRSSHQPHNHA